VSKGPLAREDHRHVVFVRCLDNGVVVLRPAGLDDRLDAGVDRFLDAVREGKKASEAMTAPAASLPFACSSAFIAASRTASTP